LEKTHIEIETNIMGKECVLYCMQRFDNLPSRLLPCCLYRRSQRTITATVRLLSPVIVRARSNLSAVATRKT